MMEKILVGLLSCTLLFGVNLGFAKSTDAAPWDRQEKEGITTYNVYGINHYFTPSKTKQVVDNYEEMNGNVATTIKYLLTVSPAVGFTIFMQGMANDNMVQIFIDAENQGKGVRTKYDYWDGQSSPSSYQIKNKSVTIE